MLCVLVCLCRSNHTLHTHTQRQIQTPYGRDPLTPLSHTAHLPHKIVLGGIVSGGASATRHETQPERRMCLHAEFRSQLFHTDVPSENFSHAPFFKIDTPTSNNDYTYSYRVCWCKEGLLLWGSLLTLMGSWGGLWEGLIGVKMLIYLFFISFDVEKKKKNQQY